MPFCKLFNLSSLAIIFHPLASSCRFLSNSFSPTNQGMCNLCTMYVQCMYQCIINCFHFCRYIICTDIHLYLNYWKHFCFFSDYCHHLPKALSTWTLSRQMSTFPDLSSLGQVSTLPWQIIASLLKVRLTGHCYYLLKMIVLLVWLACVMCLARLLQLLPSYW